VLARLPRSNRTLRLDKVDDVTGATAKTEGPLILVVEDETSIRRALEINLIAHGYRVISAVDGAGALQVAVSGHPDLVLLDLGLPGIDGMDVIEGLRGWSTVPIVVLSARDAEAEKVKALDLGADDYVTKPFGIDEVLARVRATLRRSTSETEETAVIEAGDLTIDLADKRVRRASEEIHLTPKEWAMLEYLVRHRGRLVSQAELLKAVWGAGYQDETNYLRVFTAQLRKKLEQDPSQPRMLITEPGMGHRFVIPS
jgi:two-component system, OmpR family, KDP operon response regulator KdpE